MTPLVSPWSMGGMEWEETSQTERGPTAAHLLVHMVKHASGSTGAMRDGGGGEGGEKQSWMLLVCGILELLARGKQLLTS